MQRLLISLILSSIISISAEQEVSKAKNDQQKADLVIFSYNRPLNLHTLLTSVKTFMTGLGTVSVLYRADAAYQAAYHELFDEFSDVVFMQQGANPKKDFKPLFLQLSFSTPNKYILYAVDDIVITDFVNVSEMITELEKHKAFGFFLRLGTHLTECYAAKLAQRVPPLKKVNSEIYAWQFKDGELDWDYPHTLDMTLYRKADIRKQLEQLPFANPNTCEGNWAALADHRKFGLCYQSSKMVNIPLNMVQDVCANRNMGLYTPEQLLEKFNAGLTMDIKPLFKIKPKAAHMEYEPTFVPRVKLAEASVDTKGNPRRFVLVIASYNNNKLIGDTNLIEWNLRSVFTQRYNEWQVIYIDDASTDGTGQKVEEVVRAYHREDNVTIIHNETRMGALANLDRAIRACPDDRIIVTLDGDDRLLHEDVLSLLDQVYADPGIWMTYGQYREYPSGNIGCCREIPKSVVQQNSFRELYPFIISHLRTFRAWLYKRIKVEDLMWENHYIQKSGDMAVMLPLSEMARNHGKFLPYELYEYNLSNPLNDYKVDFELVAKMDAMIRKKEKYDRVTTRSVCSLIPERCAADLCIFSADNAAGLVKLLDSVRENMKGVVHTYVVYRAYDTHQQQAYELMKSWYPMVEFIHDSEKELLNFQSLVLHHAFKSASTHILLATDDCIVIQPVDVQQCVDRMEMAEIATYALHLDASCMPLPVSFHALDDATYLWQCASASEAWKLPSLRMTIYRKSAIQQELAHAWFINEHTLMTAWQRITDTQQFALCGKKACVAFDGN